MIKVLDRTASSRKVGFGKGVHIKDIVQSTGVNQCWLFWAGDAILQQYMTGLFGLGGSRLDRFPTSLPEASGLVKLNRSRPE